MERMEEQPQQAETKELKIQRLTMENEDLKKTIMNLFFIRSPSSRQNKFYGEVLKIPCVMLVYFLFLAPLFLTSYALVETCLRLAVITILSHHTRIDLLADPFIYYLLLQLLLTIQPQISTFFVQSK